MKMVADSTTPPPPYEESHRDHSRRRGEHIITRAASDQPSDEDDRPMSQRQTIPKSALGATSSSMSSKHQHETRSPGVQVHNHNQRQVLRQSDIMQQKRFIESISSKNGFFSNITVEPVAFLAIMALFIELPSIQDLIYTKICLQVVTDHSNLTVAGQHEFSNHTPIGSKILSPISRLVLPRIVDNETAINFMVNTSVLSKPIAQQLNSGGRIHSNASISSLSDIRLPTNQVPRGHELTSQAHLLCDRLNKTLIPGDIRQEIVNQDSLFWLKYQILICLLCTISCPYWGGISDKVGRLTPLTTSILTSAASNVIHLIFGLLISLNSHQLFDVNWLYVSGVLTGLSGGQAVVIVNSFGFLSDNTTSEARSKRVMVLESVMFLSHSAGFMASRYIMKLGLSSIQSPWLNRHFVAFLSCICLNLLGFVYTICNLRHHRSHRFLNNFEREQQEATLAASTTTILSEGRSSHMGNSDRVATGERLRELTSSTPDDLDGPIAKLDKSWSNTRAIIFTLEYYKQTYVTATKARESRSIILLLILCGFISAMSLAAFMSLLFVYLKMDPFNWSTSQYSAWNSYGSISRGVALVGLTICMRFISSWNVPDPLVAALGFLSKGTGLLMIAIADSSTIISWSLAALVLSEFSLPPIRSLLSKLVAKDELGKVYSCMAAAQSICFLLGNVAFYLAYTTLEKQNFFQYSFMVVAAFQFAAAIIMLVVDTTLRRRAMII